MTINRQFGRSRACARRVTITVATLAVVAAGDLGAQVAPQPTQTREAAVPPPPAQPAVGPAIQRIETASYMSVEPLGSVMSVHELPDGRVLVNDGSRRRLLLMDSTLQNVSVVLDSLTDVANTYGTRPGALLPYRGDSVMFIDPASYAAIIIGPAGRLGRVRSVWRVQDLPYVTSTFFGVPGLDSRGRIVYRVRATPARPLVAPPSGVPYIPPEPDSAFVVAADLDTRRIDTLGVVRVPKQDLRVRQTAEGSFTVDQVINPLPATDDWAVLPDGRIAFVRALDYRIDYLNPDGTWSSSAKLPYEWQRLTEDDKVRMVDSMKTVLQTTAETQYVTSIIRWANMYSQAYPPGLTVPAGYTLPPGMPRDWMLPEGVNFPEGYIYACAPGQQPTGGMTGVMTGGATGAMTIRGNASGAEPAQAAAAAGAVRAGGAPPSCMPAPQMITMGGTVPQPPPLRQVHLVQPDELPDFKPPLPIGAMRADADGNLWIRTNPPAPIPGGPVYDIVNAQGELVTRYQLPPGYTIVGFGRGGVVYVSMRDATGLHVARVQLR